MAATLACLIAVGVSLVNSTDSDFGTRGQTVGLSWALANTASALSYARQYYNGEPGGFDFNQKEPPGYGDFAYEAFTVGMTFNVSDADSQNGGIRRSVLRHALLSYRTGTSILAVVVNLLTSLTP